MAEVVIMFEDEARFGRINSVHRCWVRGGIRPVVYSQIVREYTYAYSAICPFDGTMDSLIIPGANSELMSIFLAEVAFRRSNKHVIMFVDQASYHTSNILKIPENMSLLPLPSHSPQLNPVENIWHELREKWFYNLTFDSLDEVEDRLMEALRAFENDNDSVMKTTAFHWIKEAV
jgi:transposase